MLKNNENVNDQRLHHDNSQNTRPALKIRSKSNKKKKSNKVSIQSIFYDTFLSKSGLHINHSQIHSRLN